MKPDLFIHEPMNELEETYPALRPILTFIGLFTCCDKKGRFEWKPRNLKLVILPFVDSHSMADSLSLLEQHGYVVRYEVGDKAYGFIPTWNLHQRITGTEADAPPRYPAPPTDGNTLEGPGVAEVSIHPPEPPKEEKKKLGRKPREKKVEDPADLLKLSPDLEPWFEACWYDVIPTKILKDNQLVDVYKGRPAEARERFGRCCKTWKPVAIYLALRGYLKQDQKVKEGYVQQFATFLGPEKPTAASKLTLQSYLESVLPYLEAHPSLAALTAPPESEEAFRALLKKDEQQVQA